MSADTAALLVQVKQDIAQAYPDFEKYATQAWGEVLEQLEVVTKTISAEGPNYLPQVSFGDLPNLRPEQVEAIKRKGSVIIRDVVDDAEAAAWKTSLQEFVRSNPDVEGVPVDNKQFFQVFWAKPQVLARSHPNVLAATTWLNKLYHAPSTLSEEIDLSAPLTYADRFRIRQPGIQWGAHPPHIDGGSIERWQDPVFRTCFEEILKGNWKNYDAFSLKGRLGARTSMHGRPNQASIFRTFQGWLALSETAPTEGTLKVFPDILLSNAYIILRPFFSCTVSHDSPDALSPLNWKFDISLSDFPGVSIADDAGTAGGVRPFELSPASHPHLALASTMTSVPKVRPGDMVFWHCDAIHSVEQEHTGKGDSSVMYIPAVPQCEQNVEYVMRQKENFVKGVPPPDFPQGKTEIRFKGVGRPEDVTYALGRRALGIEVNRQEEVI